MDIDITAALRGAKRRLRSFEKDGLPVVAVTLTRTYDTDVDDLWDAVTNPERLPRWFLPVEGDLQLGGKYQLKGNAGGTITACDPPAAGKAGSFAATWEFGGGMSWIEVAVRGEGDGAHLTLQHIAPVETHWDRYGPGATGVGWDLGLLGLYLHVAQGGDGEAVDPKAFEAWSMSAAGQDFIRKSGAGWGEADEAAGEDAAVARKRADRTIAFYTGQPEPE